MKYLTIKTIKIALTIWMLSIGIFTFSQSAVSTPYSRYAFGDLSSNPHSAFYGLGNTSLSMCDSISFNSFNPASYSFIINHRPVFDIGVGGQLLKLTSSTTTSQTYTFTLRGISLGLPLTKRWGMAFGITPVSSVGYDFVAHSSVDNVGDITYKYRGTGGINRLYAGTSCMVYNRENHQLSIGANLSYLFGSLIHNNIALYDEQGLSTGLLHSKVTKNTFISDFVGEVGMLYRGKINSLTFFQLGSSVNLSSRLYARRELLAYSFDNTVTETIIDTVQYIESSTGRIYYPKKIGFGFSIDKNFKRSENNATRRFIFSAQYDVQDWGKYSEVFDGDTIFDNMRDSRAFGVSLQYTPYKSTILGPDQKIWQIASYRIGFTKNSTYLQLENTQLEQYGISFGIGIPLINSNSLSMMNIAFETGQRGSLENSLIEEKFFNLRIGFTISPHRSDPWFFKRKYD